MLILSNSKRNMLYIKKESKQCLKKASEYKFMYTCTTASPFFIYGKCSKIPNPSSFCFQTKMLSIKAGKMLGRIANRDNTDQTAEAV